MTKGDVAQELLLLVLCGCVEGEIWDDNQHAGKSSSSAQHWKTTAF